jgi:hypothetical protein
MKRLVNMILALLLMVSFAGCAGMANGKGSKDAGMGAGMVSKDAKVKCPKCGATFTVDEGQKALSGP